MKFRFLSFVSFKKDSGKEPIIIKRYDESIMEALSSMMFLNFKKGTDLSEIKEIGSVLLEGNLSLMDEPLFRDAFLIIQRALNEGTEKEKVNWDESTAEELTKRAHHHLCRRIAFDDNRYDEDFVSEKDKKHDKDKLLAHALIYTLFAIAKSKSEK